MENETLDITKNESTFNFLFGNGESSIIKVIGVGGGGSNTVKHLNELGVKDATLIICNTDSIALEKSGMEHKVQIGIETTKGLGCGAKPEIGAKAAEESLDDIKAILSNNTKMAFITAGMGGGTGTGAAPVIAKAAKDMGILTVGVVTIPFEFEMGNKIEMALRGVQEMKKHVDAMLVVNNERLIDHYPDEDLSVAFQRVDDVTANAVKGITELINIEGYINVDFADVCTILRDGGMAVMNTGIGVGDRRITKAIEDALNSPLLNNQDIRKARKILFDIHTSKTNQIKPREIREIKEFMNKLQFPTEDFIWGATFEDLEDENSVKITVLASGFEVNEEDFSGEQKEKVFTIPDFYNTNKIITPDRKESDSDEDWIDEITNKPAINRKKDN